MGSPEAVMRVVRVYGLPPMSTGHQPGEPGRGGVDFSGLHLVDGVGHQGERHKVGGGGQGRRRRRGRGRGRKQDQAEDQ